MLFALYMLLLIWLILFKLQFHVPVIEGMRTVNLIPFGISVDSGGNFRFSEIAYNILVFMPLGIYLCMLKGDWPFVKKLLAIVSLTLAFETTQFAFAIGRADITDVFSNTLGGIIGVGIYAVLLKVMKEKTMKIVTILAAILTFSILIVIAALLAAKRWIHIQ